MGKSNKKSQGGGSSKKKKKVPSSETATTKQTAPEAATAPAAASPTSPRSSHYHSQLFLEDSVAASHWIYKILVWVVTWLVKPINTWDTVNAHVQKDRAYLVYGRHSTHNADILTQQVVALECTGRVCRMLLHSLLPKWLPWIKYLGGVAGERGTAVELLKANLWCGVIPGGADEGLVGHENAYKLKWPEGRIGFAKVAMDANVPLLPFMVRNVEESRWNPILELWHVCRLYVVYEWAARKLAGTIFGSILHTVAHTLWFMATFVQVPIPVHCTLVFGDLVTFDKEVDTVEVVAKRCQDVLQNLINTNQPNAAEGRNYARALGERWVEWRVSHPKLTKAIEAATPQIIKKKLQDAAKSKKKSA